jgi:hypothetical protein
MLQRLIALRHAGRRALSVGVVIAALAAGLGAAAALARGNHAVGARLAPADATTTDPTTDTSTVPPPNPTYPPAPPGFADSLNSLYSTIYQTDQTLDSHTGQTSSQQLNAPSDFAQQISNLTTDQLAALYAATQQSPNWDQLASQAQQLLSDAQSGPSVQPSGSAQSRARASTGSARTARTSRAGRTAMRGALMTANAQPGTSAFPPAEPGGSFPPPPPAFAPSVEVTPAPQMFCFPGDPLAYYLASDSALFVAQTVSIVAYTLASEWDDNWVFTFSPIVGVSIAITLPNPIKIVLVAINLAAEEADTSVTYAREVVNDCVGDNSYGKVANIDNTTVQTFKLMQQNEQTLASTEASVNTVHDQAHVVQQTVNDQLTIDIRRALSQPTTAPRNVDYELPTSVGGNLDSTPIGVKAIVTSAYNAAKQAGLPVNATATADLAAANAALLAKNYRTAWTDYQAAYQALR